MVVGEREYILASQPIVVQKLIKEQHLHSKLLFQFLGTFVTAMQKKDINICDFERYTTYLGPG